MKYVYTQKIYILSYFTAFFALYDIIFTELFVLLLM